MKLSEMKQVLSAGEIRLTRSMGQSFLHDANQLRRIVTAAELTENDSVLEIGPGLGPLTELLLAKARHVLAIEKDRRLFEWLKQRFASAKNLTLLHDDALDYLARERVDWSDWKLVANLPYSVASPILVELAQGAGTPARMTATLQLEVARRLTAHAGDDDYGGLTLLIHLRHEPCGFFKIPASCFFPEPEVDSACVTLVRRPEPLLPARQEEIFEKVVKKGFSQRRKMMFKLLKEDWPEGMLNKAFAQAGLDPQVRAERVSLDQFVKLSHILAETRD